ncbi:MAG: Cro/CI family transcriptional regulator -like protein [Clostridiaceae bacterium]|jgi:putative transcriptional regulator|nr:Cro/CI family transcriptional regulator -like protein [Clostridiaceae bacterium]
MIKICIEGILHKKDKTVYWLSKQTGMTQNNLANLINEKTTSIKFDNLERICDALECDISDVLKIEKR